jgi:hypothetical protein
MTKLEELEKYREKFESYIQKTQRCFYWTGTIDKGTGRGRFRAGNKSLSAPVVAWELAGKGYVPKGFLVKQSCAVSACVKPDHLYLGKRGYPWLTG